MTKADIEGATGVGTSNLADDLVSFDIDKINIGKLKTVSADLRKLSNVVEVMLLKRLCDKLATKFNAIDSSKLVQKY